MPTLSADSGGKIEIHYETEGQGPPVVLVGGLTSTVEIWERLLPRLATRYRVIRPDNRGSGRTRVLNDGGDRSIPRFAADLAALFDGLGLEKAHLVGASMGGMIVQQFAVEHMDRLSSLTIACSHSGGPDVIPAAPEVLEKLGRGSTPGGSEADRRAGLEIVFHPESFEQRKEAVEFYSNTKLAFPHSPEELARRAAGIAAFDVSKQVGSISVPTLIMTGSDDVLVPPENSHRLAERIPDSELVLVDEAGHVFFVEHSDVTVGVLMEFLARA